MGAEKGTPYAPLIDSISIKGSLGTIFRAHETALRL